MGKIYKLKYYLDIHTLTQLYYTLIYSYLTYGIISWRNTYKSRLNKLISKQKSASVIFSLHIVGKALIHITNFLPF